MNDHYTKRAIAKIRAGSASAAAALLAYLYKTDLSPGVADLVLSLNRAGLITSDSGDGSNHAAGMECALPLPHVFIICNPGNEDPVSEKARQVIEDQPDLIDWPWKIVQADDNGEYSLSVIGIVHEDW